MATAAAGVAHFQPRANILRRSEGHSAAGKAAYNARCRIENDRTGKVYDFSHLPNQVIAEHFYAAANAPEWARTPSGYWNGVERRENRSDSQLAMDWVIDLPYHLQQNPDHARRVLQDFIRENFQRRGYGAHLVFHPAHDHGDERNFHAHLMVGIRRFEKDGTWANAKDGVPDPDQLLELRERMAVEMNGQLRRLGYDFQVDHRSYEARGIDREGTVHLGKSAAALERQGLATEKGDTNRAIEARNDEREMRRVRIRLHEMTTQEVETTLERLRREDEQARADAQRGIDRDAVKGASVAQHDKDFLNAVRRLMVTMGGSLGNVINIDRGDLRGQGATFRSQAVEERRRLIAEAQERAEQAAIEERRRIQERLAVHRAGLEAQLRKEREADAAKMGFGPIAPKLQPTPEVTQDIQEQTAIEERRRIQERLAEHRAGLEAQLAKEAGAIQPKKLPHQPAIEKNLINEPTSQTARMQQDVVRDRAGDATRSSDRSRSWMGQTGGYEELPAELKASAEKSYAKWSELNPDKAKRLTLDDYVAYTQQQEQKRETVRDQLRREAKERGEDILEVKQHPAQRMERELKMKRPKRPEDDIYNA